MRRCAALALATLALAACGSGERTAEPAPSATTGPAGVAQVAGVGLDGEPLSFAEFRGRPLLVNVWSSW